MLLKKISIILVFVSTILPQNLQLHYEAAADREYLVSTLEMFKPDKYGSTFWFVDMEYNAPGVRDASLAYWEISRAFILPLKNMSAIVEYNDGVASGFHLGQAWLIGMSYYLDLGFVALPLNILYRAAQGSDSPDFQLTTNWFIPFMDGNVEFSGFFDIWSQDESGSDGKQMVILTEPQLWYNANEHLAIGSEVEISHNFIFGTDGFQALPTLGLRWTF